MIINFTLNDIISLIMETNLAIEHNILKKEDENDYLIILNVIFMRIRKFFFKNF